MVGESQPGRNCEGFSAGAATQMVNGYKGSSLYGNHSGVTTFRPWSNEGVSCYTMPGVINPPYDSLNP